MHIAPIIPFGGILAAQLITHLEYEARALPDSSLPSLRRRVSVKAGHEI
jgi:hypothetical protein